MISEGALCACEHVYMGMPMEMMQMETTSCRICMCVHMCTYIWKGMARICMRHALVSWTCTCAMNMWHVLMWLTHVPCTCGMHMYMCHAHV